jgi:small ligand-binding sensory domain FIST
MKWASAVSKEIDAKDAVAEVLARLKGLSPQGAPQAIFVFASPHHSDSYEAILEALHEGLQPGHLIGCSGGGVIGEGRELEDEPGLSVTAAWLPGVKVSAMRIADADLPDGDSPPRAWEASLGVSAAEEPQFLLLVSAFMNKADDLLAGLDYAFPKSHKIGGIASGLRGVGDRALFLGKDRVDDGAVVMVLSGDIRLDTLVAQGCRGIGNVFTITQCDDNMLIELDGKPALKVLTEIYEASSPADRSLMNRSLFVGIITDPLVAWPPKHGDFLIRNVLGIDPSKRSMAVGATLREGQAVRFHLRDAEAATEDLKSVLESHLKDSEGAEGALLFSCMGRGEGMFGHADHDSQLFKRHFGDIAMGGVFCNGEIGPVGSSTYIHGFTSSFGIFRKK